MTTVPSGRVDVASTPAAGASSRSSCSEKPNAPLVNATATTTVASTMRTRPGRARSSRRTSGGRTSPKANDGLPRGVIGGLAVTRADRVGSTRPRHTVDRMRRSTLALLPLVLLGSLLAAACSGDDSASTTTVSKRSGSAPSTTDGDGRAGRSVRSSSTPTRWTPSRRHAGLRRLGVHHGASAAGPSHVAKTCRHAGPTDLTDEQMKVLTDTLDECIPGEAFARFYMATVYDQAGLGEADPEAVSCLTEAVDGKVGRVAACSTRPRTRPPTSSRRSTAACRRRPSPGSWPRGCGSPGARARSPTPRSPASRRRSPAR